YSNYTKDKLVKILVKMLIEYKFDSNKMNINSNKSKTLIYNQIFARNINYNYKNDYNREEASD
ncbi:38489_t:CDS:1, partial [Gigaspora margarita]